MIQNNRGNALKAQALQTGGAAAAKLLAQAVNAYGDALQLFSKRDFASSHDIISRNLEEATLYLAAYDHETQSIEEPL